MSDGTLPFMPWTDDFPRALYLAGIEGYDDTASGRMGKVGSAGKEIYCGKAFPDRNGRLHHIFAKQVYGSAPAEIICRIAAVLLPGFDRDVTVTDRHFRLPDALKYAGEGTPEAEPDKVSG